MLGFPAKSGFEPQAGTHKGFQDYNIRLWTPYIPPRNSGVAGVNVTPLHSQLGGTEVASTATAGSDVVQSGRPIFDDFFQHLWPYIGNNTANVVFQMVKRLWLIRIDQ
ncbi:hypothetical protein TNCV_3229791 [Trichonephila clavipes]|nr:hypothetical protein TNCV_3229791 [Trichonephila clavipes]